MLRVRVATRARAWLRIHDSDLTAAPRPVPRPRPPPPAARLRPPRRHPAVREWPPLDACACEHGMTRRGSRMDGPVAHTHASLGFASHAFIFHTDFSVLPIQTRV